MKKRTTQLEKEAQKYLSKPYSRILVPQDAGGFSAEVLEFPGCFAEGETADETYANLEACASDWLVAMIEKGEHIPSPLTNYEASGRFALRLPRSLYARAAKAAAKEGISLNQYISNAVAERLGSTSVLSRIEGAIQQFTKTIKVLVSKRM